MTVDQQLLVTLFITMMTGVIVGVPLGWLLRHRRKCLECEIRKNWIETTFKADLLNSKVRL